MDKCCYPVDKYIYSILVMRTISVAVHARKHGLIINMKGVLECLR